MASNQLTVFSSPQGLDAGSTRTCEGLRPVVFLKGANETIRPTRATATRGVIRASRSAIELAPTNRCRCPTPPNISRLPERLEASAQLSRFGGNATRCLSFSRSREKRRLAVQVTADRFPRRVRQPRARAGGRGATAFRLGLDFARGPLAAPKRARRARVAVRCQKMAVALERIEQHGDLFEPILEDPRPLAPAAKALEGLYD
jgi:hypothetical protein